MASNNQPLSPQGYNLGAEPYNTNPFWDEPAPPPPEYHGVPAGGAPGQVLTKQSYADYDADWADPTGGGGEGGTTDYNKLTNKPAIDGVTLDKDSTKRGLDIASAAAMEQMDAELEGQISKEEADRILADERLEQGIGANSQQIQDLGERLDGQFAGGQTGQVWTKDGATQGWRDPPGGGGGTGEDGGYYQPSVSADGDLTWQASKAGMPAVPPANIMGPTGPMGPAGPMGPSGPKGETGPQGPAGPDGTPGSTGPAGPAGPEGPAGKDGAPGERGPAGPEGPAGKDGAPGEQGPQGERGPAGPEGPAGKDGAPGEQGPQGERGPVGPEGPAGPKGDTGAQGPKGDTGARGPQGEPGKDAALPGGVTGDIMAFSAGAWRGTSRAQAIASSPAAGDIPVAQDAQNVVWTDPAEAVGLSGGTVGQVLTRIGAGYGWADPTGGGGGDVTTTTGEMDLTITPNADITLNSDGFGGVGAVVAVDGNNVDKLRLIGKYGVDCAINWSIFTPDWQSMQALLVALPYYSSSLGSGIRSSGVVVDLVSGAMVSISDFYLRADDSDTTASATIMLQVRDASKAGQTWTWRGGFCRANFVLLGSHHVTTQADRRVSNDEMLSVRPAASGQLAAGDLRAADALEQGKV